jgi:hypothetical protein
MWPNIYHEKNELPVKEIFKFALPLKLSPFGLAQSKAQQIDDDTSLSLRSPGLILVENETTQGLYPG